jgi:redox-sensitive bicupin YhaK (pirin superfamily)
MKGMPVLEAVPSRGAPTNEPTPFILVRRAGPPQLVLLGPGEEFTVADAAPGTRYMLMTGKPYGEAPVFNGPFVD